MPELITKGSVMLGGNPCMLMQGGKSYTPVVMSQDRSYVAARYCNDLNQTGLAVTIDSSRLSPSAQTALSGGQLSFTIDVLSPNYVGRKGRLRRDRMSGANKRSANVVRKGTLVKRCFTPAVMSYVLFNQTQTFTTPIYTDKPYCVPVANTTLVQFTYPNTSIISVLSGQAQYPQWEGAELFLSAYIFPSNLRTYFYDLNRKHGQTSFSLWLRPVLYNSNRNRYLPTISRILEYIVEL